VSDTLGLYRFRQAYNNNIQTENQIKQKKQMVFSFETRFMDNNQILQKFCIFSQNVKNGSNAK